MRTAKLLQILFCSVLFLSSGLLTAAEAPEEVYKQFHDSMLMGDLDTMLKLSPASIRAEMESLPAEQKQGVVALMGKLLPRTYKVLGIVPGADAGAGTLYVSGMGASLMGEEPAQQYGTIDMVMEDGNWKVGKTDWNSTPPKNLSKLKESATTTATASAPLPAPPATPTAPATPAASAAPAPAVATVLPAASAPVAAAQATPAPIQPKPPEKKKPVCIIKQVMSNAEIHACRLASAES